VLGLILDPKLQWTAHTKRLIEKIATRKIALMIPGLQGIPMLQARQVYTMVIRPAISHGQGQSKKMGGINHNTRKALQGKWENRWRAATRSASEEIQQPPDKRVLRLAPVVMNEKQLITSLSFARSTGPPETSSLSMVGWTSSDFSQEGGSVQAC
jgi:hypothetical protein